MADLRKIIKGLEFGHPVLPLPGENVAGAAEAVEALKGGAAALVLQTVTPQPGERAAAARAAYGKDGAFHLSPCSAVAFDDWVRQEFPTAVQAARDAGVPCIPSIGYAAHEVGPMAGALAQLGADALFYDTTHAGREEILPGVKAIKQATPDLPVIVKLSPHHGEDLADLALTLEPWADAFCLIGAFGPDLLIDVETGESPIGGTGFLSGAPIRPIAQRFVYEVAKRVPNRPIFAAGGVISGADVVQFTMLGAAAVMVGTHALVKGPAVYGQIATELSRWLDDHGHAQVGEIYRAYIKKYGHGQRVVIEKEECPQLNEAACIKCTFCETVCFYDAIKAPPKTLPTISYDPCFECGLCVSACPTDALFFRRRDLLTLLASEGV